MTSSISLFGPSACRLSARRRVPRVWVVVLALCATGCATAAPPQPPEARTLGQCPLPLVPEPGRTPVRWIRIENPLDRPVIVFLDRCLHHTRIADIDAGKVGQARRPRRVPVFDDGLRMHVFDAERLEYVGLYAAPLAEGPVLRVSLEEPADGGAAPTGYAPPGFSLGRDEQGRYAAVFAAGTPAILSWACREEGSKRHLTLSTAEPEIGPPVLVRHRFAERRGRFSEPVAWTVIEGPTDALSAPPAVVRGLTAAALGHERLELAFEDASGLNGAHAFPLEGLVEALTSLPCFATVGAS